MTDRMSRRSWTRAFRKNKDSTRRERERPALSRLELDDAMLRVYFPDLFFSCNVQTRRLDVTGTICVIEAATGQPTKIALRVEFPQDYPRHEPIVFDARGRFNPRPGCTLADRHINSNRSFCLWLAPLSRWKATDPDALRVLLDRVTVFCDDQLAYDVVGRFPYGEWQHYDEGYAQYIFEKCGSDIPLMDQLSRRVGAQPPARNDPCLCGSGAKYKVCHREQIEQTIRALGADGFRKGLRAWIDGYRTKVTSLQ
jgi:hypothetical protein